MELSKREKIMIYAACFFGLAMLGLMAKFAYDAFI